MSILSPIDQPTKVEIISEAKQEYKFIGNIYIRPGHKLFCFNPTLMEVNEVVYTRHLDVNTKGELIKKAKTNYDPKCIYVSALNIGNAIKKINKLTGIGLKITKKIKHETDIESKTPAPDTTDSGLL